MDAVNQNAAVPRVPRAPAHPAMVVWVCWLLACAPVPPRVELYPSGVLVITENTFAPSDYAEEMARCAAKHWGVPEEELYGLTIRITRGYGVTCSDGKLRRACYEPPTRTVRIADEPGPVIGGVAYWFPESLFHELTHWSRHVLGLPVGEDAEWFYRPGTCY